MAHIDVMKTYRIALEPAEFKLVCDGLRKLGSPESRELNARLTELSARQQTLAANAALAAAESAKQEARQ